MAGYLSPKLDVVFRMIFERNTALLGDFLLSVLDIPPGEIEKITILNPISALDSPEEKKSIMDLKLELASGRRVNVEIQVRRLPDMVERIHYYKARMVTEQLSPGNPYAKIVPTSCVVVLDYEMYEDEWCHHAFRYHDKKRNVEFSQSEEIHILELPKRERDMNNPELGSWLQFFNAREQEEFDMLSNGSEVMKQAVGVLASLSADEKSRMLAEAREKELRDQMSRERGAREEGREEGKLEGRLEVARKLIVKGFPISDVADTTGLSVSEVEKLMS